MFDSISIGMSGLQSFSKGLKVIGNNVANLNTPGFKASNLQFADLFYQGGTSGGLGFGRSCGQLGTGVTTLTSFVNFKDGETRQTGNPLDLSIDGAGFFVTQDAKDGSTRYTRAGQFEFDKDGNLISRATGRQVMGYVADGTLGVVSLNGLRVNPPKITTNVKFAGNLSSTATDLTVEPIKLFDAVGGQHVVKLVIKPKAGESGSWTVTVLDGAIETIAGDIKFVAGVPVASMDKLTLHYAPSGAQPFDVVLDFSSQVTSFSAGSTSTLAVSLSDGFAVGMLTQASFDANGVLSLKYSNGNSATGAELALATFESHAGLTQQGAGEFESSTSELANTGRAGSDGFGKIASNQVEISNVDLSSEFSDLIIMQRGYQASSRIVSTANEMLQELFDMKGHR
jgi:flagellar hook protein FlgE